MAKLAARLLSNLEIILAFMSLPVIAAIHLLVSRHFDDPWKVTAAAAISIGVLHGVIGWLVRARQRTVRLEILQRIGAILQKEALPSLDYPIRLALAQFPALVREPLMVKALPAPDLRDPALQQGWSA